MDITIRNAILHVLSNDGGENYISKNELDIDSEACFEFIVKHVKKLMNNPSTKEATFNAESVVYKEVKAFMGANKTFKEASETISIQLSDAMRGHADIPSADFLIVHFEKKGELFLALIILHCKECYTHSVGIENGRADNQLVKHSSVLPFDSGKVTEAVLIPYDPMILKILEKPYNIEGEPRYYFSELFLDCEAGVSKKEAVRIINAVTEEINDKYYNGDFKTAVAVQNTIIEEAEDEDGAVSLDNVAARAFADNAEAKEEYIELVREAGLRADVLLGEKYAKQQFGVAKIKTESGVEIKFPAELYEDKDSLEFIDMPDGRRAVMVKGI